MIKTLMKKKIKMKLNVIYVINIILFPKKKKFIAINVLFYKKNELYLKYSIFFILNYIIFIF